MSSYRVVNRCPDCGDELSGEECGCKCPGRVWRRSPPPMYCSQVGKNTDGKVTGVGHPPTVLGEGR